MSQSAIPLVGPGVIETPYIFYLDKYMGRWYEAARTRNFYQQDCALSIAEYRREGNQVRVMNQCIRADKQSRFIFGKATQEPYYFQHGTGGPKHLFSATGSPILTVTFGEQNVMPVKRGNYCVLSTDYINYSIVGSVDGTQAYILSRSMPMPFELFAWCLNFLRNHQYDISERNMVIDANVKMT